MKKQVKKLVLCRETLRNLGTVHLRKIHGAATVGCGNTDDSECGRCYTGDVTDCPGCNFTDNAMCLSNTCGGTCATQVYPETGCYC